ncbi:energy-coupling factor ABC transporter ATP-binding protein [Undibacterium sp. Jales W-56]|uniref:ABC transporter ATP-binding protein n=1 Tax=Undibacterium sp. Jales W-56 TaxID=2897325 RepID=UPI0021CECC8D|nr:energy-coupling factor ABC transporter ATP-binding protein [Undibacterium sp. Jales W-56]MCU6434586.1 energy-coupling factor ABC transporter ATP-binding protein [Undibacterium sp. Jales W-56]
MSNLLSMQGLQKQHGDKRLLDIEHLSIASASAYVLTGINGAGKSSLLRILCGLDKATIRQASLFGKAIHWPPAAPVLRDTVVYVHQHPVMFADTVTRNIGYGLKLRGGDRTEQADAIQQVMTWAGISHLAKQAAQTLSGGEKQRVALARAKILRPKLLLLDEPTSNLDGEAREQVIALIPDLIRQGSSIIMVCHDRDLIALPNVQRWKLRDGKLETR